ncbi:PilW family protein [Acidovorax sp.]|uniref:PilW family protein n=1 Tax=Acidovorax sp. TaxID=1872122 RepID=UPI00261C5E4D|nr:PilW family protein [Acidovorax sp.]
MTGRMHMPIYQQGFTLVELLVAMTLGLLITLAASTALYVSRQGFFSVDAASQLRDNARYAQDIIQRLGVQAGFKNVFYMKGAGGAASGLDPNPPPHVFGINNQKRTSTSAWDAGTNWGSTDLGKNSDILVLRAQVSTDRDPQIDPTVLPDGTMIDCLGVPPDTIPTSRDDRFISILHVQASSDGEPALMCSRGTAAPFDVQPLVQGVETFQVLYGVDNVVPGTAPSGTTDSIPERYLRADQLTVSGNDVATYANWRRVRSIRIGMVLRSKPGSAVDPQTQVFYPLGTSKNSATGVIGSAFANATNDPGTEFTAPADGRVRQTLTFTVHLRNFQELETN